LNEELFLAIYSQLKLEFLVFEKVFLQQKASPFRAERRSEPKASPFRVEGMSEIFTII
jgi:hypothetical protein